MSDPLHKPPPSTTFDNQLIELESVDSTNNYAMARIHEGLASDGMVCLAHTQTAGRGQRGRTWVSEPGQNLMMSLVIAPNPLDLSKLFLFSASVALGILDTLRSFHSEGWQIKWPNDIYYYDRKAAGILIENAIQGQTWHFAVVGIGMNLNQEVFPPDVPNAISLRQIQKNTYDPLAMARMLVPTIQNRISTLKKDSSNLLAEYHLSLYKLNAPVTLKRGTDLILTRILGVTEQGVLITENGSFGFGEVQIQVH